jgi:hypothetical protein
MSRRGARCSSPSRADCVGDHRYLLFFSGRREVASWEIIVPALALALIGCTLFRNLWPYPTGAGGAYPAVSAA